jgi:hypothetical protein
MSCEPVCGEGFSNCASRAALKLPLPMGLTYAEDETVILDPDAHIQQAVGLLFATFTRTGSATATVKYFRTKARSTGDRCSTARRSKSCAILATPEPSAHAAHTNDETACRFAPYAGRSTGSMAVSPARCSRWVYHLGGVRSESASVAAESSRRREKIAGTVLRGKAPPCFRDWSSVGGVGIG